MGYDNISGKRRVMSDCMNTYTGLVFEPMYMTADNIRAEDIAHALSLLCRGGGHIRHFYSVGQHSMNCASEALARGWSSRVGLACLLHDASEAYISDIIRPVKKHLTNYLEIESMIMEAVLTHFGLGTLTEEERRQVRQIDDEMLMYELHGLMPEIHIQSLPRMQLEPDLSEKSFMEVEKAFLEMLRKLENSPG